ncbi:MAG: AAA family ATPase, partial [Oscillospiraceae bacterium]
MLEKFVGSKNTVENITLALKSQRLANSILVCGEDGLGRGYFARLLAADYLYPMGGNGAVAVENGNGAEVINVLGEGASGQISAKRIREVRSAVCETSLSSTGRVVIIKNAHMMNQSSANALLKILEEPPEGVLFILCAKNAMSVMATIRSRCGIFSLCAPSIAQC